MNLLNLSHDELHAEISARLHDIGAYPEPPPGSQSRYIRFHDKRMGSLRIADHHQRDRYNYTWNVWTDGEERPFKQERKGLLTFHVPSTEAGLNLLERELRARYQRLQYGLPKNGPSAVGPVEIHNLRGPKEDAQWRL